MENLITISLILNGVCLLALGLVLYLLRKKTFGTGEFDPKTLLGLIDQAVEKQVDAMTDSVLKTINASNQLVITNQQNGNTSLVESMRNFTLDQRSNFDRLEDKMQAFMASVETRITTMRQELTQAMQDVRKENEVQLSKMRETVDEKLTSTLNSRLTQSFSLINEQLEAVSKGLGEMRNLNDGVVSLNRVLSNVKTRGNWGEMALENLLDQIMTQDQYLTQVQISKDSQERVDFAILLPGDGNEKVYLPIDAKFPLEDYERLIDASEKADKAGIELYSKALIAKIKDSAKSINRKYVKPPKTTDFAIMYLPIEGLFAEVVKKPGLCDELQNKYRVVLCGPTTITALLNSLQIGFKTLAIQERSSEIWKLLATFKTEFGRFSELLAKTQKQVDTVSKTIQRANKRTHTIQRKLDAVQLIAADTDEGDERLLSEQYPEETEDLFEDDDEM